MSIGLFRDEKDPEPIPLEKIKLLINGAILTFEWTKLNWKPQHARTREIYGFKVNVKNIEGPFGTLDELSTEG